MARSPPAATTGENKPATVKRKGTRSVSTLTPSQLARKRANDREAQRAIRARTKELIERLQRELEESRGRENRDGMVRELLQKNKALEHEVRTLREALGIGNRPFPQSGYEMDGLQTSPSAVPGRGTSYPQGPTDYGAPANFGSSYLPTPEPCETWPPVVPVSSVTVPSVVSSPSSSTGHPDEYVASHVPTSVPSSMMDSSVMGQATGMSCIEGMKVNYEDIENDRGYCSTSVPQPQSSYLPQQSWSMYPTPTYYPPQSPTV